MLDDEITEIARFRFLHQAELAAASLRAGGIDCMVRDQFVGGVHPELIFTGEGFRVLVRAGDADRAREVLNSPATTA